MSVLPERGHLVWVDFSPHSGHEQAGRRPALVISSKIYHQKSSFVLVCPITSNVTPWPWKVILPQGSLIQGAVLVDQLKSIDRIARNVTVTEIVSRDVMDEVTGKIAALLHTQQ